MTFAGKDYKIVQEFHERARRQFSWFHIGEMNLFTKKTQPRGFRGCVFYLRISQSIPINANYKLMR